MAARDAAGRTRHFSIGRALGTSFSVLSNSPLTMAIITVVVGIPYILVALAFPVDVRQLHASTEGSTIRVYFANSLYTLAVLTVVSQVTSAALAYATLQGLQGRRVGAWESVRPIVSRAVPVLLAALLFTLLYWVGVILILLPGLFVLVAFWLCMPAIAIEQLGVVAGFRRSWELTKGRRWAILGLLVLVGLVGGAMAAGETQLFKAAASPRIVQFVGIGLQIAYNAYSGVLATVGYYYLRADQEGVAVGDVAHIFG